MSPTDKADAERFRQIFAEAIRELPMVALGVGSSNEPSATTAQKALETKEFSSARR